MQEVAMRKQKNSSVKPSCWSKVDIKESLLLAGWFAFLFLLNWVMSAIFGYLFE